MKLVLRLQHSGEQVLHPTWAPQSCRPCWWGAGERALRSWEWGSWLHTSHLPCGGEGKMSSPSPWTRELALPLALGRVVPAPPPGNTIELTLVVEVWASWPGGRGRERRRNGPTPCCSLQRVNYQSWRAHSDGEDEGELARRQSIRNETPWE